MSIDSKLMARVIEQQRIVQNMRIWCRRLPTDDGYEFAAAVARPGKDWNHASPSQIEMIAARALSGNY